MIYTTFTHEQLLQMQPYIIGNQVYIDKNGTTYKVVVNEQGYCKLKEVVKNDR